MRKFSTPITYNSELIQSIKNYRTLTDKLKKDLTPSKINLGNVNIFLPRNFGFCYGVENAISITHNIIEENKNNGRKIYLLSELIHNPQVNDVLVNSGIKFLFDIKGNELISINNLNSNDIVIIPAFGTTLEIETQLESKGIDIKKYNSTCPFVEKVWRKGKQLSDQSYTIIIHGKHEHEETQATFSRIAIYGSPCLILKNIEEAKILGQYITGQQDVNNFKNDFKNRYTPNFNPTTDLKRIGLINQTTLLSSETEEISNFLKQILTDHYQIIPEDTENIKNHFADTRDTLCYATNDNQEALKYMMQHTALDFVIVIGGKNSSNTGNLYKIAKTYADSFFIQSPNDILNHHEILSYDLDNKKSEIKKHNLFKNTKLNLGIVIGASCPDVLIIDIIKKIMNFYEPQNQTETRLTELLNLYTTQ